MNDMRKRKIIFSMFLLFAAFAFILNSCKKDDKPDDLNLVSLSAGSIDLNSATSPDNVPVNPTIIATFSTNVDETTATGSNITLIQDYDNENIDIDISTSGNTVTVTPREPLGGGALYKLSFDEGLRAVNGRSLAGFERTFTTEGTFVPTGQVAYWNFENNANDQIGNFDAPSEGIVAITYTASRNEAAGLAATFDGSTSIIEVPNGDQLMNTNDFTLAFWVHAVSEGHPQGHFVLGLAAFYGFQFEIAGDYSSCKLAAQYELANGNTTAEDLWFPGDGISRDNGGWQGWTYVRDLSGSGGVAGLLQDKWAQVVCIFNSQTKVGSMYINGEKMKEQDFNLWPEDDPKRTVVGLKYGGTSPEVINKLAFGFIQSRDGTLWDDEPWGGYDFPGANHFKGQLDDVRIFHKALTETEVQLMYNSEKP
jgi:hypothetical protein